MEVKKIFNFLFYCFFGYFTWKVHHCGFVVIQQILVDEIQSNSTRPSLGNSIAPNEQTFLMCEIFDWFLHLK